MDEERNITQITLSKMLLSPYIQKWTIFIKKACTQIIIILHHVQIYIYMYIFRYRSNVVQISVLPTIYTIPTYDYTLYAECASEQLQNRTLHQPEFLSVITVGMLLHRPRTQTHVHVSVQSAVEALGVSLPNYSTPSLGHLYNLHIFLQKGGCPL